MKHLNLVAPVFAALLATVAAIAQEPTYMDAATHPGAGQLYSRLLVSSSEYEDAEGETEELAAMIKLVYGILPTLAVLAEGKLISRSAEDRDETGLLWSTFQLKYRIFKKDLGPINSWMTSAFAGVTVPGALDATNDMDAYPRCALVSTAILRRHGVNTEFKWEAYGSEPDRFTVNASHLYRLAPVEYAADTRGAWYTMLESLNQFSGGGDSRFDIAAGILYEARRWACETSLRLPLAQDWPGEEHYQLTVGIRYLH